MFTVISTGCTVRYSPVLTAPTALPARPAQLLGLDTRCWTGERRAGGVRAAGTAVAQAGREDIADYALEWAVRTLWRARRAHHSRSGPRRDDMPSPAKACRHGLLGRPWPPPPSPPATGLLQYTVWRARRAGDSVGTENAQGRSRGRTRRPGRLGYRWLDVG